MPYWRLSAWYFFYFAFVGVFSPYFGIYLQSLNFQAWQISLLLSLMPAFRLLAPGAWSYLADRLGCKTKIIQITSVLSMAGFLVIFVGSNFVDIFFGMTVMIFFWSASLPLVEALTLDHLCQRVGQYGHIRLWGSIGFIVAVMGVGIMLDTWMLRSLLWVILALLGGVFVCSILLPESSISTAHSIQTIALGQALQQPRVLTLLTSNFFMAAAHGPLYVFYSIHLMEHGYTNMMIGSLWSLGVLAEILVFFYMPHLFRRYTLRGILFACFISAVLRFMMIGWSSDSLLILTIAQLSHGMTFGACHAATVMALHQWFRADQQARIQAIYGSTSFGAGGLFGGLFGGYAWGAWGAGWTYTTAALFSLIGGVLIWRGLIECDNTDRH